MGSPYGPGFVPRFRERDRGAEIADAIEGYRQAKRQEELDAAAEADRTRQQERQEEADARAEALHALQLHEAGVRDPTVAGETSRGIADELERERMAPRIGPRGPALEEDTPIRQRPEVEAIQRAATQFYKIPGTDIFIDPAATPQARAERTTREREQREEDRFVQQEVARRGFQREEREAEERFAREERGAEATQRLAEIRERGKFTRYGAEGEEDPRLAERRQAVVSAAGRPVTQLQQDLVDALAEGMSPEEVEAELERVNASPETIQLARRYMIPVRTMFPRGGGE